MRLLCVIISLLLAAHEACGQATITLRPAAVVEADRPVVLADVATLSGDAALDLAEVQVLPTGRGAEVQVTLADVRSAIKHVPGINLGRLAFSGSRCTVRSNTTPATQPATPSQPSPGEKAAQVPAGISLIDLITSRIAETIAVPVADLKLDFGKISPTLLNHDLAGRAVVVHPTGKGGVLHISVRIFNGDSLESSTSFRATAKVRRQGFVATSTIERGGAVLPSALEARECWLAPDASPATAESLQGAIAATRIAAGDVVETRHVRAPFSVRKGDILKVDVLSGGVVVQGEARALSNGGDGEEIELESVYSRKRIRARITGPGRAATVIGGAPAAAANTGMES